MIAALYWTQHFYIEYKGLGNLACVNDTCNFYTVANVASYINEVMLVIEWTLTALVWSLTITNDQDIIAFFVLWCGALHYIEAFRFVLRGILKLISFFTDNEMDYYSISGFEQTYAVSKQHYLAYWPFIMEWGGFMTSFLAYMNLSTILPEKADDSKTTAENT
jgi:hypothetical protein